jgi:spoIIIJ-associated protein
MTDSIEKIGKTVEEATIEALKALKVSRDDAEITILEPGSKGIFGIGSKPAKVLVKVKFDPEKKAKTFLREIAAAMKLPLSVTTNLKDKQLFVNITGDDMGILIGKRGQTLDSLQYLVNLVVNKGNSPYVSVTLDTENYRQRRKETLESLALNLAKKVKATHKNVVLEPMNPSERRIIHAALQPPRIVPPDSERDAPFRNVVIAPKRVWTIRLRLLPPHRGRGQLAL